MRSRKQQDSELPLYAKHLFANETAIKKVRFMLSRGGTVQIGIFPDTVDARGTLGVFLLRDKDGKTIHGTVCKTKDSSGVEWYEALRRELMLRSNWN